MKGFKRIIMVACAVVVATMLAALPGLPVEAQSSSLSIVPKKNYVIEPGKSIDDKLVIRNLDNQADLELSLRVVDFTYTDDSGTPKLFLAEDAPQTTWSLKPFMKIPQSVTIPRGGSKSLDMSVTIPKDHGAGSYYSAIIYSTGAPDGGNVGLAASGVTLVFTQIPGKVHEDLKLEEFGLYIPATASKEAHYTWLTADEPRQMAYTLKNSGNVTEAPVGSIIIRDIFGNERKITSVNPNQSLALIGQSRTFSACIKLEPKTVAVQGTQTETKTCASPGMWPGFYTASLHLFYGQNGNITKEVTGTSSFWYLPVWFVILVVLLLAVIAYFVRKAVLKIRNMRERLGGTKQRKQRRFRR